MAGYITVAIFAAAFIAVGFGWGRWYAEQQIRRESAASHNGRLSISMPADPQNAAAMLGILRDMMKEIEEEQAKEVTR